MSSNPSDSIIDEIIVRLNAFYTAGTWAKLNANKLAKLERFWTKMKGKAAKKAAGVCGKRSRAANSAFYAGILFVCHYEIMNLTVIMF